jgi:hypothetical protein
MVVSDETQFDRAIEMLLADRSPRSEVADLSMQELRMVRVAQLLRGRHGPTITPEFKVRLRAHLFPWCMIQPLNARAPTISRASAVTSLHGLRLGRCARRILLLAPGPTQEPSVIPVERAGRAAAESHRRAIRRLAEVGLLELAWKQETSETKGKGQTGTVQWDHQAGMYRDVDPKYIPIERVVTRRAVKLTALGALLVDRLRRELETGKRIRWDSLMDTQAQ